MKKNLLWIFIGLVVVFIGGLCLRHYLPDLKVPHIPVWKEEVLDEQELEIFDENFLLSAGNIVLNFLSQGNIFALQEVIASEGLTFLPYPNYGLLENYWSLEKFQTFSPDMMSDIDFLSLPDPLIRGTWDGIGEDIVLTTQEYYDRFIWDHNYLEAPEIFVGDEVASSRGNTLLQLHEMFLGAKIIEYHFPSFEEEFEGLDWRSLYLVFVEEAGGLFLRAIAHGERTI